ncbi:MAG TPA: methylated-DNA--[protein]-cysteine S-methyltransferase [Candidatus Methylomirabilis sp.]|nr:methylated-DNA--[protein]-cysteine S-methyltransferase [Candidatus Methylomirabilis sp.]
MRRGRASVKAREYDAVIVAPFGRVGFVLDGDALVDISFLDRSAPLSPPRTTQARQVSRALQSYFANPQAKLRLTLTLSGTAFQQRVWRALQRIPPGRTLSYGALAKKLNSSARAVGNACRANPVPIVVPCHRVVAANGPGGFMGKRSGSPLHLKQWLLEHERGE